MGFSISWLAVRGKPAAEIPALLSLTPTGRHEEIPESPYSAAALPGGWSLLVFDRCEHAFLGKDSLRRLSAGCEVVAASAEEHVMASLAEGWKDGQRLWRLAHESEQGLRHLEESGALPKLFGDIREKAFRQQESDGADGGVDYIFDVPLLVAQSLTGFKHDEGTDLRFEILEPIAKPSSGGLWGRLFGKR